MGSIYYPIIFPTSPSPRIASWKGESSTLVTESPFTGNQQVQSYESQRMAVECSLPPMDRASGEDWISALLSLYGSAGTVLFRDTAHDEPRGAAGTTLMKMFVRGAGQTGRALNIRGAAPATSGILLAGDWLQIAKNQVGYPTAFDNAAWSKINGTIATGKSDPEGGTTACRFTPGADPPGPDPGLFYTTGSLTGIQDKAFRFSVWLKSTSGSITVPILVVKVTSGGTWISNASLSCAVTTSWQRFEVELSDTQATAAKLIAYIGTVAPSSTAFDMWGASLYSPSHEARLHKCISRPGFNSDANGFGTVDIYGGLHDSPPDFSRVLTTKAWGEFRLVNDNAEWTIDNALKRGLQFSLMEAF